MGKHTPHPSRSPSASTCVRAGLFGLLFLLSTLPPSAADSLAVTIGLETLCLTTTNTITLEIADGACTASPNDAEHQWLIGDFTALTDPNSYTTIQSLKNPAYCISMPEASAGAASTPSLAPCVASDKAQQIQATAVPADFGTYYYLHSLAQKASECLGAMQFPTGSTLKIVSATQNACAGSGTSNTRWFISPLGKAALQATLKLSGPAAQAASPGAVPFDCNAYARLCSTALAPSPGGPVSAASAAACPIKTCTCSCS